MWRGIPQALTLAVLAAWTSPLPAQEESGALAELLGAGDNAGFPKAIEPRRFSFPADHGPHPAYRNEWWYFTGNLDGEDGRRFGFELTIFRFSLTPPSDRDDSPADDDGSGRRSGAESGAPSDDHAARDTDASRWRSNQVYIAHFAVTDVDGGRFLVAEKYSRGALGLAGASAEPLRIWIDDWEIRGVAEREWRLRATDDRFSLDLALRAKKPPVLNGKDGLSQKSAEPGNASYYYSMTRWQTDGQLRIEDERFDVSGASWLDREWSSSALSADQQGWDWFALQLSDNTELMFYGLRRTDGSKDPQSAGTWVAADGQSSYLARDDVEIDVTATWDSPAGGTYPAGWTIRVPGKDLEVDVTPVMADQELFTTVRYWEGAVDVRGTRNGKPLSGRGYVELTGYADP